MFVCYDLCTERYDLAKTLMLVFQFFMKADTDIKGGIRHAYQRLTVKIFIKMFRRRKNF